MSNQLALINHWQAYKEMAAVAVQSGLNKQLANNKEAALLIIMQGLELGLQPMAALRNIHIINGRPCLSAQLMAGIIKAGGNKIQTVERTGQLATVKFIHKDGDEATVSFSWEEAVKAGLTGKDVWKSYPADMLWNRAIARGARQEFPEIFAGLYSREELEAIDQPECRSSDLSAVSGEVVEADATNPTEPQGAIRLSYISTAQALKEATDAAELKRLMAEAPSGYLGWDNRLISI